MRLAYRDTRIMLRARLCAAAVLVMLLGHGCTDGAPLTSPGAGRVSLSLVPQLMSSVQSSAPVNRIHLLARDVATGRVLADTTLTPPATPGATWNVGLELDIPPGTRSTDVSVVIELLSVAADGTATIEFSGMTNVVVTPGSASTPSAPIQIHPGPPGNLTITAIDIRGDSIVREADTLRLSADVTGATGEPRIIWRSLDPTIASVDATGLVRGILPGAALIEAIAGPRSDAARVIVRARPASIDIVEDSVTLRSMNEEAQLTARVLDPRGAALGGAGISWTSDNAAIAQSLGGGRFAARGNGRTVVRATSLDNATLVATAVLVVSQRAARIELTPAVAELTSFGETTALTARAFDASGP
jgi:hypothetical protein